MKKHYVYVYCDPRKKGRFEYEGVDYVFNYEPFYVGEGAGYRFKRHVTNYELDWNYNKIKNGKIKHIIKEGYDPLKYVVIYKDMLSKDEAGDIEKEMVKKLGRINIGTGILSNLTDGGEGWKGARSPFKGMTYEEIHGIEKAKELKEKRRKHLLGNDYGKKTKGQKMSNEQKEKLSKIKRISVMQFDKEMNLIKIWDSCKDAADHLGISVSGIHNVLNDKMPAKTAGGFKWEFVTRKNKKYH